jgi:hypothetical protein
MSERQPIFFAFHTQDSSGVNVLHGIIKLVPSDPDPNKTAHELLSVAINRKFSISFDTPSLKRTNSVRLKELGAPINCMLFGTDVIYFLK